MPIIIDPRTGRPFEADPNAMDPTGLGVPAIDPNATPVDLGQALSSAASAIFPTAGQPGNPPPTPAAPLTQPFVPPPLPPEPAAPAPVMPVPAKPRTNTGGVPGTQPGGETKGEKAARAGEKTAQGAQLDTAAAERELGERKAIAEGKQTEAEQQAIKAHYDEVDRRTTEGMNYLQKEQDKRAAFKMRDLFDGQVATGVAAALMEGLGAYSAILTGGENHATRAIERGRQNFRQTQLDDLEQQNKNVADAKDRIELTRAELAAREAGMFKNLAAERAKNMARFGYDQARVEGDKIYNDLLGHQSEAERTYQSMLHTRGTQEKLVGSEIAKNYAAAAKDRAELGGKKTDPAMLDVTGPDGKAIFRARSPEEAKDAKEQVSAVRDVLAKAQELKGLIAQGRTVPGSDRAGQMEALQSKIMIAVNHAERLGAMDKGTQEILERMLPTGYGWSGQGPARIDQFLQMTREGAAKKFDAYGVSGQKVVGYLERTDSGAAGGKPAASRTEYAREAERLKTMKPGSPEYTRQVQALKGAAASMGM